MKIPIVIMTFLCPPIKDSLLSLETSLSSAIAEFEVIIVNNSAYISPSYHTYLLDLKNQFSFISKVVPSRNKWILSLNCPEVQEVISNSDFFVITDDDIIYPDSHGKEIWLDFLIQCFSSFQNASKIGLHVLPNSPSIYNTSSYQIGHRLKDHTLFDSSMELYKSPVDTTPALYRTNSFAPGNNSFSPRHNQLLMPNKLNLRTTRFSCYSLSNDSSFLDDNLVLRRLRLSSKAICFANVSASLSVDGKALTPLLPLIYYEFIRPFSWLFWSIDTLFRRLRLGWDFHYLFKRQ